MASAFRFSNPDFLLGPCQVGAQVGDLVGQLLAVLVMVFELRLSAQKNRPVGGFWTVAGLPEGVLTRADKLLTNGVTEVINALQICWRSQGIQPCIPQRNTLPA